MSDPAPAYPKRLIEVDLPIARISAHARREKSIRHGHISSLHIWWARRPLAACRAVICAALWPDPADELCPPRFRQDAHRLLVDLHKQVLEGGLSPHQRAAYEPVTRITAPVDDTDTIGLREALLDFIGEFANPDLSTNPFFLRFSRSLTQSAHQSLGGQPGTKPLVIDPFAGGGSIPLEALRVGADAFASDLNPIPVVLNTVSLNHIPRFGQRLADQVKKWGHWVKQEAEKTLASVYPQDADGATPIAYLWARTIQCEGPGCGVRVPLIRSLWLSKKPKRSVALQLVPNREAHRIDFKILIKQREGWSDQSNPTSVVDSPMLEGTVKSGSVTCPCCGYTTQNARVRAQLSDARGGASTARLTTVVVLRPSESGRYYRLPTPRDEAAVKLAETRLFELRGEQQGGLACVPNEPIPKERPSPNARGLSAVARMGVETFGDLFTPRQSLALATFVSLIRKAAHELPSEEGKAVRTILALCVGKMADLANSCCLWEPVAECPRHLFARQAVPIVWDFSEGVPIGESSGSWDVMVSRAYQTLCSTGWDWNSSDPQLASATQHPLPDDAASALFTDPPYYDSVPYGDISDFFYVWLRRALDDDYPELFGSSLVAKDEEAIWATGVWKSTQVMS